MLPEFKNPPKTFRPSPFWSWNDDLEDEELVRQVRDFKDKGFGGYFMHSRVGLRTKYLSDDWMQRIAACLEEGKRLDMESWLYDEDKWPSGAAGGLVTRGHDEFRSRGLSLVPSPSANGDYLAVFELGRQAGEYRRTDTSQGNGRQRVAFEVTLAPKTNWFNGESYADLLKPEAVQSFLTLSYEPYAAEFRDDFGEFMPGIFTDEPHIRCGDIPWTDDFPAYFQRLNGYDILDRLPELFYDLPGSSKSRYDFWRTATKKFVEEFSQRLYAWCEKHKVGLTGHYLHEDTLLTQMLHSGAAMPHYEFQQFPGIDHLGRNIHHPLTLKQVSSAAHQLGRKRVLCEIYGVSGHSMTFEDQKWIADFHFAMGINFMCQHLVLYSMKGDRKRDYPPTISYHQPYWPQYRFMNDYLSRCCYAISTGKFQADALLLHPIPTAWTVWRKGADDAVQDYDRRFAKLMTSLLELHIGFDLGDELLMERHAVARGERLSVGRMDYGAVIVPPSKNWSRAVLNLLGQFEGPILVVGEVPTLVDGEESAAWKKLLDRENVTAIEETPDAVASNLENQLQRSVSVTDESGREIPDIYIYHRTGEMGHLLFLANISRTQHHAATVRLAAPRHVTEWDPADGCVHALESNDSEGKTAVSLDLPPAGSKILAFEETADAEKAPDLEDLERIALVGPWSFRRVHPNSMTLDFCRLSINDSPLGRPQPVWRAREEIRRFFKLEEYKGIQPWVMDEKHVEIERDNAFELQFEFDVRSEPERILLVLEEAFKFELSVNGHSVDTDTDEWHWDRQFSKIDVRDYVTTGRNVISIRSDYQWDTEIEEVYLVGDFAVEKTPTGGFRIAREPAKLREGDWGDQGYPFYCGNMVYTGQLMIETQPDQRYWLDVSAVRGCLCRVSVNGRAAGLVAWHPMRLDVTPFITEGGNSIHIEVVSTLRNTMGPLHHAGKDDLPWVGPEQFVDEANWTDDYHFVPYGLFGNPELIVCREVQ